MSFLVRVVAGAVALSFVVPVRITAAAEGGAIEARNVATLQRWSDPATWGGALPVAGQKVTIPSGTKVLLDTDTPALAGVMVNGTLRFARRDLALTSKWVMVHGALQVGTAAKPFKQRALITLTGTESEADVMGMGTKALGVMAGTLDLHGQRIAGWTKLSETAAPSARQITLERDFAWRPGDRIVIASSDYWRHHDEERTITGVSGRTIEFAEPLAYRHWGQLQTVAGRTVDERAEVGLLSRNITIRGDASSTESGFGGHMMIMEGATARIEGVEFENMGQRKRLRRYPVHFHMDGAAPDSYLKRSSIHHSFNRCVVVHGTHQLRVTGNVCYDHIGHGFFLEDGIETDNIFPKNLGLGTKEVENGLLPSDRRAATFWITNPDNVVNNNVAAGSDGIGFWFALPKHPTGLSATDGVWPRRTALRSFKGNVAHSNGDVGLNVDHGPRPDGQTETAYYSPLVDPSDPESAETTARFEDFTAYYNRDRGIWSRGENHVVTNAVLADNRAGATFASSESFLENSLVVGETANKGMTEPWEDAGFEGRALPFFWKPETPIVGFEFYDGRVGVSNTTFVGFKRNNVRESGALGYLTPDAFSIHPKNFAENVTFFDATEVYLDDPEAGMDGDVSKVFIDRDGSVTGTAGQTVVVNNPFLLNDSCSFRSGWNAHICTSDYATVILTSHEGSPEDIKPVTLTRSDGVVQTLMGCCDDSTGAVSSLIPNQTYDLTFNGGTPGEVRLVLWNGRGDWVQFALPAPPTFSVNRWGYPVPAKTSLDALAAADRSAYYYDSATSTLHLRLMGRDSDWEELRVETA